MEAMLKEDFLVTAGSVVLIQFVYGQGDCQAQQLVNPRVCIDESFELLVNGNIH